MSKFKKMLIGRPLTNKKLKSEKYGTFWGLPILASDPISSVAYATEEILIVLLPAIGLLSYGYLSGISAIIVGLLLLLVFSYRQTIKSYPSGGGAYVVAKDNLGIMAGITAGAALSVDYTLTVAVSISAGVAAIISAAPNLAPFRITLCILFLLLLMVGNLRGIRESSKIFSIPTYAFVVSMFWMIIYGFIKINSGYVPPQPQIPNFQDYEPITLFLLLRAFSAGCAALTGVEAVSNAVPNFKEPAIRNAQRTLLLLGFICLFCFGGVSILANLYHIGLVENKTVLSQIAAQIFGNSFMFYFIQGATALLLVMAANTAYTGFPMLISTMATDGFAPRQLNMRGDRLSYSNGITLLTILAGILIFAFNGDTHLLIPLYAVGVFLSFTLSQTGMFVKWLRQKDVKNRNGKMIINGAGAFATAVALIIIGTTKFIHGAWIVVLIIPILMIISFRIKKHYLSVGIQLHIEESDLENIHIEQNTYTNHVVVPIASVNRASIRALKYARTISDKVIAFNVAINEEDAEKIKKKWSYLHTDIQLVVKYSPFRKIIEPLLHFVESEEHEYKKGDIITVILPQFSITKWWQIFLHNQSRVWIANNLLKHRHIVVATMPLQLKDDDEVLKQNNIKFP
jgi:amino acid transporter